LTEAPLPGNEAERLAALQAYEVLDTDPEEAFDDLASVAARICGTPIALVSLIDEHRQWFKARIGLDATETPRSVAFCAHAILEPDDVFIVSDSTEDPRFADNPLVTADPEVIFYAGAPLVTPEGMPLGTLCVIDHVPRELSDEDRETLRRLARATVNQLELRKAALDLREISEELARSNQDLANRNDEIRRFYQSLSHELKTPLTVTRDYVSMVLDGLAGPISDEQEQFLTVALGSCDRIAAHVDDLLDLTRIETGKLRLDVAPVSVGPLLESVVTALTPAAERADVRLECRLEDDLPTAEADEGRVMQVVSNLVKNAVKFTPAGGEIHVCAQAYDNSAGSIEISVRDTGRGIPADDLERVFERLYQCRDDDAGSRQGLGLGLYLCREIIRLHGGDIFVESTEGVGTTFRFILPAHSPRPGRSEPALEEARI
jgi:signal transduction histidine kinase